MIEHIFAYKDSLASQNDLFPQAVGAVVGVYGTHGYGSTCCSYALLSFTNALLPETLCLDPRLLVYT